MSSSNSVSKAAWSAERKRLRNRSVRSNVKSCTARAEKLISAEESDSAPQAVVAAISSVDKAVKKGVIHRNKGARLKSQLMKRLNALPEKGGG